MWVFIVLAVIVVVGLAVTAFSSTSVIDRVRRTDPEAAAKLEQHRAEQALRGRGPNGLGGGYGP